MLVRLACLARVQDQKDYESLRLAWKALGDREKISLTDHFLADGIEVLLKKKQNTYCIFVIYIISYAYTYDTCCWSKHCPFQERPRGHKPKCYKVAWETLF